VISQRSRAALVFVLLALFATACGGSDDSAASDADAVATPAPLDTSTDGATDDGAASSDEDGSAADAGTDSTEATDDAMADEPAGDAADAAPELPAPGEYDIRANATGFVRALFNLDPSLDAVDCLVAEAEAQPTFERALAENAPVFSNFGDETLYAVTTSVNGCVDAVSLGGWAMEAVGPTGDVRETAPDCFAERFSSPDGDDLFHIFIALSFQYRYDPQFVPGITDTLVTCTPVTSLAPLFANQAEAESNYDTVIDRDCFVESIDNREASEEFWSTLIDGQVPPFTAMAPYLAECATIPNAELGDSVPADFVPWAGTGALASVAPAARANAYSEPPPMSIDPAGSYTAVFATGGGEIRIKLFADTAPVTVNNFVSLARDGFFDQTVFHRVLDEFMAQGGDPTGTGTGGPGYQFQDETAGGPALDKPGLLAMANSGPNTNGSQFFITFVATEWLTGNHTVFGEVVAGQDIVDAIERRDPSFPESRGQVVESVTIIEE
jgi:cyclophilin family peptidyl-prolyl cis-trans isomerase